MPHTFTAADRALFEAESLPLFEAIVVAGSLPDDDERIAEGAPQRPAFDLLVRLGLVRHDEAERAWLPEDPASVQSRVVSPMSLEGTRLLDESSQWSRNFAAAGQAWRRSATTENRGPFTYLHGLEAIDQYLSVLVAECETEIITAQPQTGRDTGGYLARAIRSDTEALERGVRLRTLYQHSARRSSATREYVSAVTPRGAEVRTLDEFFNRLLVFDRRVAVIPSPEDLKVAVAVREPSVVAYLIDVFERSWERARPFTSRESTVLKDIAAEQRAMTMRMLIEGHSDPVSAKRLGVSPRTYAGYVADLKEEFEVETRFQLGYTIGRQGITGRDDDEGEQEQEQ